MSQDGASDCVLCITTLSTMINLFQGNQSVLFSDMKGDLSKTRVMEMPPTATRSKLEKTKYFVSFCFIITLSQLSRHHKQKLSVAHYSPEFTMSNHSSRPFLFTLVFTKKLYLPMLSPCTHQ